MSKRDESEKLKHMWQSPSAWLKRPVDPSVPVVARRFAIRLFIVLPFAALPLLHTGDFSHMFVLLTGFNALYLFFTALLLREKPNASTLNHYDEALGMAALCLIGRLFL